MRAYAFAGSDEAVTREDLEWIFRECAGIGAVSQALEEEPRENGCSTYALSYIPDTSADTNSKEQTTRRMAREHLSELLNALKSIGATVRIIADGGRERMGMMLICLPGKMSLRMRAMLSFACPDIEAKEINDASDSGINALPAELMKDLTAGILDYMMIYHSAVIETEDIIEEEWLLDEDLEPDDSDTAEEKRDTVVPVYIEDMDLSIRAYNCLSRAGIHTVAELRDMTDEELKRVRNLGRKSFEEVKEKLAKIPIITTVPEKSAPTYTGKLDELIGLESVKEQVRRIAAFARMQRDMESRNMATSPIVLNMEFIGNPGTAKTTVARVFAGIFHEIGLLKSSEIVEVGRADLVARYTGQTADQVKAVFRSARGKLLFIDEAYSLIDSYRGGYGDEAINTIVQEMENNRRDTVVIFAGYPERMEEFFSLNPGLRTRVPFTISFPDYSADEIVRIAELEANKRGFSLSPEAIDKIAVICGSSMEQSETGNGRFCRNFTERAILNYAYRVYGSDSDADKKDCILIGEDFTEPEKAESTDEGFRLGFTA